MSKDECKVLSEQIASRIDAETDELKKTNEILKTELQQKDQDISKVEKNTNHTSLFITLSLFLFCSRLLPSWRA